MKNGPYKGGTGLTVNPKFSTFLEILDHEYMENGDIKLTIKISKNAEKNDIDTYNIDAYIVEHGDDYLIYIDEGDGRMLLSKNHLIYQKIRYSNILARKIYELIEGKNSEVSILLETQ